MQHKKYVGNPIIDLSSAVLPGEEVKLITPNEFDVKPYMYAVTSYGRVLSIKDARFTGKITEKQPFVNKSTGYYSTELRSNTKNTIKLRINRLVATYFVHNPDPINKTEVDHIDDNRANNAATNLQWLTRKEQMDKIAMKNLNSDKARQVKEFMENNPTMSVSEIARQTDVSRAYVDRLRYELPYSEINYARKQENNNV
jgi:aspartyl-tRNA synthetase